MISDQFPHHWQILPLEEAVDALIDYRGKTPKKTNSGIPLITAKIVKGGAILPATEFIAEEDYDSWMIRGFPQIGDVVVTTEAPLGEVAQLSDSNVALAQRIVTLRGVKGLLFNDYLRYVMQGSYVQRQLESRATGSTVSGIKQSELRKVLLPIPSLQEQIFIASHLKSLDDKIQLSQQINQTLEQMAQAIFKSWFVDFEPVKAKIAALEAGGSAEDALLAAMQAISGKNETQLTLLQAEQPEQYAELRATAELFPSAMQESELGEIPEGWDASTIGQSFILTMGQSPPGDTYNEIGEGVPFYQGRTDFGFRFPIQRVFCTEPTRLAQTRDSLVSVRAPVGDVNVALQQCALGRGVAGLRHPKGHQSFVFYSARSLKLHFELYNGEGTVFGSINKKDFQNLPIVIPSANALKAFENTVAPLDSRIETNEHIIRTLSELRGTLLLKLLSGELRLPEAEAQIQEAADAV